MQYYLPKNYNQLSFEELEHAEFEAESKYEKAYKELAWNKASKDKQAKAKAFVSKYIRGVNPKDAEYDFIWDSLENNEQEAIKNEIISNHISKIKSEQEFNQWHNEFHSAMNEIKAMDYAENKRSQRLRKTL